MLSKLTLRWKQRPARGRRRKGTSGNRNAIEDTDDVISVPSTWSPFIFLSGDVSAPSQGGWADGEPQHRDSWGERRACPRVGPVSLGSLNGLSRRSNSKVQIPEPGRGSGKLTGSKARPQKGQNNGNWISALRIEPGARTASESEPRWSSTFIVTNLLSSPSPFSQWRSKEKQGQGRGFGVRRFSLSPYSLIISHVMLNLFGLL